MKTIIISYPRSGKSYLQSILTIALSNIFDYSHLKQPGQKEKLKEYDYIISLVRNPIDSISSIVAMQMEFNSSLKIEELIKTRIEEYCDFYSFSLANSHDFINFNDIVKNIAKVVEHVSFVTKYPITNNKFKNIVADNPKQKFLKSSKKSKYYNEARAIVSTLDLSECNHLYNMALKKCVVLNGV